MHGITLHAVQGDATTTPQDFIVGMRGHYQHARRRREIQA
jgi:hypothetical protein